MMALRLFSALTITMTMRGNVSACAHNKTEKQSTGKASKARVLSKNRAVQLSFASSPPKIDPAPPFQRLPDQSCRLYYCTTCDLSLPASFTFGSPSLLHVRLSGFPGCSPSSLATGLLRRLIPP